jgi:hypothetical protein
VVDTDEHMAEGESIVLNAAAEHWGLHRTKSQLQPPETPSQVG